MAKKTQQQLDLFDTLKVHMHAAVKIRSQLGFEDPNSVKLIAVAGPMLGMIRPDGLGKFQITPFPPTSAAPITTTCDTREAAMAVLREASNSHFDALPKPPVLDKANPNAEPAAPPNDLETAMADYIHFLDKQ